MRTRTRKPLPLDTLLNHFDWAARRNHSKEMRKARDENQALKLALRLKQAMGILLLFPTLAFSQPTPPVPTINVVVTVVQTNATPTNAVIAEPPHPSILPLSMQMRMAAQLARGKASPWLQRFMVSAVEEKRADESTNYLVTVVPITDETNAPVSWGTTKNNSIRFYTIVPTKKGDEFELFPVKMPLLPQP